MNHHLCVYDNHNAQSLHSIRTDSTELFGNSAALAVGILSLAHSVLVSEIPVVRQSLVDFCV